MTVTLSPTRPVVGQDFEPVFRKDHLIQRIIRVCVFKFAALVAFFERLVLNITHHCLLGKCFLSSKEKFDPERAQRGTEVMKALGGEVTYVTPSDKEGFCELIHLKASNLKAEIERLGGRWERRSSESGERFEILFPQNPSADWSHFYETVLKKTPWKETLVEGERVMITANHTDLIKENAKTQCIFHADLAIPYQLNRNRFFHFLGMGCDVISYNGRGMFSEGYPSEAGCYADADACFAYTRQYYDPSRVCLTGSCGDSAIGGFLLSKYHHLGLNAFFENFPPSIPYVIQRQNCIARWLGMRFLHATSAPEQSSLHRSRVYVEDQFNTWRKFEQMQPGNGYAIFAATAGDNMVLEEDIENTASLVFSRGSEVLYLRNDPNVVSSGRQNSDPHMSSPYKNPDLQRPIMKKMFTSYS